MKFQNPSFKIFLNERTHGRTHGRTDKPKAICSPLFQSWGHKNTDFSIILSCLGSQMGFSYSSNVYNLIITQFHL